MQLATKRGTTPRTKARRFARATLVVVAALTLVRTTSAQKTPDMKTSFGVMNANVAKITAAAEKERWQANADAWRLDLARAGTLPSSDLDKLSKLVATMKANVAKVTDPAEKERWQANIELWQLLVRGKGAFGKSEMTAANTHLATIKTNVAKITDAAERERWQANRDMWQAIVDRASQHA